MHNICADCVVSSEDDRFGSNLSLTPDGGGMGKEDRVMQVLEILANSECALPPVVIFRNAKIKGATFERRSVTNYLQELHGRGLVVKVDPESLENGNIVEIQLSEDGYYIATEEGREFLENED